MKILFLWVVAACVFATTTSAERGSSLRGALEALQRRQRGRMHGPPDYETLYEVLPPQAYPESEYDMDIDDVEDEPKPNFFVKLVDGNERPPEAYEYKIMKKNAAFDNVSPGNKKQSAFRERIQHSDNDKLRDVFIDSNEIEEKENIVPEKQEDDNEYAILLWKLWAKYKANKAHNIMDNARQGVVKYKEKIVKKSYPDNWGPIAFKRKRSSDVDLQKPETMEYEVGKNHEDDVVPINPNYNAYETTDNDKDDMREEYAIAFQPLDDDSLTDLADEDQYAYDTLEKRFPVTKRSSEPYIYGTPKKRFIIEQNNEKSKTFRSSAGTDPRILKDLSKIFGDPELTIIKTPVKRSSDYQSGSHEILPPNLTALHHNNTDDNTNHSLADDLSHEHQGHNIHPPGVSGKEIISEHDDHNHKGDQELHNHDHKHSNDHHDHDAEQKDVGKPIILKKKSIDWSDYFGIDKRRKKSVTFVDNLNEDRLKKQYFDTFNKEVIYPSNSFRKHSYVKRNYGQNVSPNQSELFNHDKSLAIRDEKRSTESDSDSKLDNIDKKLKNMEGLIVDEALHYTNIGDDLDSKEEQEMKEKLLSRLAAAYSLEKMRKALKEFKQSLQVQKILPTRSAPELTNAKDKKAAVKKENALIGNDIPMFSKERAEEFEGEQGAGHYLNGKTDEQLSEGYMGGSGRHRVPVISTATSPGSCPVLSKIIQRCRGVDLLAGDRGQLFLPLCSLHQICYLCGEAPPTTCDLVFLSEADSTCEGDMSCQRAVRSTLMALRELHDNLADELDGECEASPCLPATLKLNLGWQRALQR